MRQSALLAFLLGTAVIMTACGDSVGPESVAGTYVATSFTLAGATNADVLAEGGSITTTLTASGTTTGTMFIPAALNEGVDLTADLTGTFTINGQALRFSHTVNTFLRDITWIIEPMQLRGSGALGPSTVSVVLTLQ